MHSLPLDPDSDLALARLITGQMSHTSLQEESWAELIPLALSQGMGPMLYWVVREAGGGLNQKPCWELLECEAHRAALDYLLLERARRRVCAALDREQVPAIWLKGIALAHSIYPAPRLRPMHDLDLLVPLDRLEAARRAAAGLGFRPAEIDFAALAGSTELVRHHDKLVDPRGQVCLELHFRLLMPDLCQDLEQALLDWFWEQTEVLDGAGRPFTGLKPEANMLYLCAHLLLQHDQGFLNLLHLLDLHLLVTKKALDWDLVIDRAAALCWSHTVERALELAQFYYHTPVPDGVLARLGAPPVEAEQRSAAAVSAGRSVRWEEWKLAFHGMSFQDRLRLVWITLLPPGDYVRQHYRVPAGRPLLPYYLYRWFDGGREAARSLRHPGP